MELRESRQPLPPTQRTLPEVDVRVYLRILKKRWLLMAATLAIVPGALDADDAALTSRAASYVQSGLRVLPVRESRVFTISFIDRDPRLAAELANAVAAEFIDQNRAVKVDATRDASHWVAKQLDDARKE